MQDIVAQATASLSDYADFVPLICFAAAFFGSLVGTNLIVPTGAILASAGVLVGAGVCSWSTIVWAAAGAYCGCSVSFSIGKRFGSSLIGLSTTQAWLKAVNVAKQIFRRQGQLAILVGYFAGPARAPVAAVAAAA